MEKKKNPPPSLLSSLLSPLLFSIFPILFLLANNIKRLSTGEIMAPLMVSICTAIFIYLLHFLFTRRHDLSSFFTSMCMLIFLCYGHVFRLINGSHDPVEAFIRHRTLIPLLFLIYGLLFYLLRKKSLITANHILNRISIVTLIIPLFFLVTGIFEKRKISTRISSIPEIKYDVTSWNKQTNDKPDIYYLIFDGYGGKEVMKKHFDYDNSAFYNFLYAKGFQVLEKSRPNYLGTFYYIASTLNMMHLPDMKKWYELINRNAVFSIFKKLGYHTIHVSSGTSNVNLEGYADEYIEKGMFNEFRYTLLESSVLLAIEKFFVVEDFRTKILYTLDEFSIIPEKPSPKFVFAHILCPHVPFVFGKNGEKNSTTHVDITNRGKYKKELYINQYIFITKKIMEVIEIILNKSGKKPVILLQSDHGPPLGSFIEFTEGEIVNDKFNEPLSFKEILEGSLNNINAVYIPENKKIGYYDSMTAVNTFRVLFNHYFDAGLPLLEDSVHWVGDVKNLD